MPEGAVRAGGRGGPLAIAAISVGLAALGGGFGEAPPTSVASVVPPLHPQRIVVLGLHADELALALAPERVVAVDGFADDPAASFVAAAARRVPGRASASVESVLAHEPDLVVLPGWASAELEAGLSRAGVAVAREPVPSRLAEVDASIARLGALLDAREAAETLRSALAAELAAVDAMPAPVPTPRAVLVAATGTSPGEGTLFAELIARAGGRIARAEAGILPLSVETLLALDPEVVFLDGYRADGRARGLAADGGIPAAVRPHLQAYRRGRVHELPARLANTTSHHIAETLRELARFLRR